MARNRNLDVNIWTHHRIADLSAHGKLVYLYLFANPHSDACGCVRLNSKLTAFTLGLTEAELGAALAELTDIVRSFDGLLALRGWIEHNTNNPNWRKSADDRLAEHPPEIQAWIKGEATLTQPLPKAYPTLSAVTEAVTEAVTAQTREVQVISSTKVDSSARACRPPACPHQKIVELYHQHLPMMPAVKDWTANRQRILKARWNEKTERQSLEHWAEFFRYVAESDFLCGRAEPDRNGRTFIAYLEWLVRPTNYVKVIEGKYHPGDANQVAAEQPLYLQTKGLHAYYEITELNIIGKIIKCEPSELAMIVDHLKERRILSGMRYRYYRTILLAEHNGGDLDQIKRDFLLATDIDEPDMSNAPQWMVELFQRCNNNYDVIGR